MAYCERVNIGDSTAIVRYSGRPPADCEECGRRRHTVLCDYRAPGSRKTCNRKLCDQCAVKRFGADFCPTHLLPKALGE